LLSHTEYLPEHWFRIAQLYEPGTCPDSTPYDPDTLSTDAKQVWDLRLGATAASLTASFSCEPKERYFTVPEMYCRYKNIPTQFVEILRPYSCYLNCQTAAPTSAPTPAPTPFEINATMLVPEVPIEFNETNFSNMTLTTTTTTTGYRAEKCASGLTRKSSIRRWMVFVRPEKHARSCARS
jgi:hypothetical protein